MISSSRSVAMKRMGIDRDSSFLPEEIITNILKRLPVKSLIRFQCVCKHWKNLFKTQSFIADHHLHHSTHQNPFLLFKRFGESHTLRLSLLDPDMQVLEVQNVPLIDSSLGGRIVGSSNGLLCVELNVLGNPHSLLLWNPATRDIRQVPQAVNFDDSEDFCIGFGFSPVVNDYKIVRIYVSMNSHMTTRVEVYSLSTGSWKAVEFGNLDGVSLSDICLSDNGFNTSGAIYWFGLLDSEDNWDESIYVIVSFDIAREVFTLIPILPATPNRDCTGLTVFENKLAMLSHTLTENFESSIINLWVMEEGTGASDERWNWTKKYTSSPYPCLLFPVTIWRDEIVCNVGVLPGPSPITAVEVENDKQKIVLFNLTSNKFKMLSNIRKCSYDIFNYMESLVPVGNVHIEEPGS